MRGENEKLMTRTIRLGFFLQQRSMDESKTTSADCGMLKRVVLRYVSPNSVTRSLT